MLRKQFELEPEIPWVLVSSTAGTGIGDLKDTIERALRK